MMVAAASLALTTNAVAQDAEEDEILVTGSRIVRQDLDSASPVTTLDREELTITGVSDIGDLIQTIPSMSGSPIGTTTNNGGNGSVRVDLRGLGTARTLTLVDGKRMVDNGDFQTVPGLMIERVDILKDGASAVYGADAVAGVVNVITRKSFEGLELVGQYNDWDQTANGETYTLGAVAGTSFDRGNVMFGVEYVDQEEAFQRDFPWDIFQDSYYIYPEGCENQVTDAWDGSPTGGCYPLGSSRIPESRLGFGSVRRDAAGNVLRDGRGRVLRDTLLIGTPATEPYTIGVPIRHDGRNYNYAPVNYLQTPYSRLNLFANAEYEVLDGVDFNVSVRTNDRQSAQELAPAPFNSPTDPAHAGLFDFTGPDGTPDGILDPYNGVHEANYYLRLAVDAFNASNGLTQGVDLDALAYVPLIDARRRMIETNRRFTQDVSQTQINASLDGEIDNVDWEVYANHGYRSREDRDFGQFNGPNLSNALGPSADLDGDGRPECYSSFDSATGEYSGLITGCVPFNFFGGGSVVRETGEITASSLTQDMIDYVSANLIDRQRDEFSEVGAGLTGSAFELPSGEDLGWAAGVGYWQRSLTNDPDSAKQAGQVTGNTGSATSGEIENYNAYLELFAPVWSNGTQRLDLKAGLRYDDFSELGEEVTWQVGAELQALEALKLRGTAGTIFRVPTIFNLFGGLVDGFPTFTDPCTRTPLPAGCPTQSVQLDTQVLGRFGGNPNLRPETGDTLTLGAVLTPDLGDVDLSLTVDYYKVSLDDAIGSLGVQNILEQCYVDLVAEACALVTRRNDSEFSIAQVIDAPLNINGNDVEGIDTEVRATVPTGVGDISGSFIWTHVLANDQTEFDGSVTERVGRYNGGNAFAEDKFNYTVGWERNGLSLTYRGEFIGSLDADTFCNCGAGNQPDGSYRQDIDSQLYHDLVAGYSWDEKGLIVTGGVTNLTNEAPPFIETGFNGGTDPATYRVFGRGFFVRAQKNF